MKNKIFLIILALIFLGGFFSAPKALAQNKPIELYFFRGEGCPHCVQAEAFFSDLVKEHPQVQIKPFEVYYNNDNRKLYFAFAKAYNLDLSNLVVPVIFLNDKAWVGYDDNVKNQITNEVLRCANQTCSSPQDKVLADQNNQSEGTAKQAIIGWAIIILVLAIIVFAVIKLFKRKK
ncbi:MAG: hypothetical protein PHV78_00695 [Patescibacteria group bacterium]|nr:hypothetical protein [Patescibacteria group bacterium]MDD5121311.1 hypothetical protein [Patescibacteria group bacterium]MDD5221741.1 hypothetical protein [Patescibacteria group bacterium]MDD5395770.1 hypothetical protein [Patescibacteria group bacterium]